MPRNIRPYLEKHLSPSDSSVFAAKWKNVDMLTLKLLKRLNFISLLLIFVVGVLDWAYCALFSLYSLEGYCD